ncbi:prostaglandin reductase 1-like [Galleria mellonella]|uniref:Prostaglandin reductase 1 n=1 Tax=Galleria mellonella TaxID=7137 RepID=A0ABM3MMM0_GALME|nr:prostaglandin reductase 1-like [Galleria mellonella]
MVRARKYVVKNRFQGSPKRSDYSIIEQDLPPLKDGEILVKTEWISVDPYLRAYNSAYPVPYDQFAFQVGVVQESKDPNHPVGSRIVSHKGWCNYSVVNMSAPFPSPENRHYKLPNIGNLSPSLAVGALGMPGATAYLAFLETGQPKPGETVVITGAGGAVGSLVGQIAKIKGCNVIGFTGSDKKAQLLKEELGFDKAFNYKSVNIEKALQEAAPNGVDIYFDNVGGEISSTIMYQMNYKGRVIVVGSISSYNSSANQLPQVTLVQPAILFKSLKVEGFLIWNWSLEQWNEAFVEIVKWIESGQLKAKEHISEGFDNLFDVFIGMLNGDNFGKAVVRI